MSKKFPELLLSLLTIGLLTILIDTSCNDKVVTEENTNPQDTIINPSPSEFRGEYRGEYQRIKSFSSVGKSDYQHVKWIFTDTKFWCEAIDENIVAPFVCDFNGFYEITNKINLRDIFVPPQCDHDDITDGAFDMRRKVCQGGPDSLFMEQYDAGKDTYKVVRLVKTQ
jgi:hypothetical protein